jgi:hypothetical protein
MVNIDLLISMLNMRTVCQTTRPHLPPKLRATNLSNDLSNDIGGINEDKTFFQDFSKDVKTEFSG